ncbi:MAG: tripartite tricarboxylate transporter substrate binding protein [Burkholderiales bacterium]|nr:tripartite tricarboxylate transporter substrate binding protein [Burkholderiales bacterium]
MTGIARWVALLLASTGLVAPAPAPAQAFPGGPITIVVPLAPGDAADVSARALGEEVARLLGTAVVTANRPGGGGTIGANSVVQAPRNGQTLLFAQNSALTIRPVLEPQAVPYDVQRDLLPLGLAARTPSVLAVRADAPYKSFAELIEFARKRPGQVRIGHPGAGSAGDFCIQLINSLTGAGLVPVPFTGAAPAVTALRGEHIEGVVLALGALAAQIKAGAFQGLVTSAKVPDLAAVPTLRELGFADELFGVWFAFLAPAGIPDPARRALTGAIETAVRTPAIAARLAPLNIFTAYATPDQLAAEIRDETRRVGELARKAGLTR